VTFDHEIRKLCDQILACTSEREAVKLTCRLKALLHGHIEELRNNLITLPAVGPVSVDARKAS